jgi:hypothetical protein
MRLHKNHARADFNGASPRQQPVRMQYHTDELIFRARLPPWNIMYLPQGPILQQVGTDNERRIRNPVFGE